MADYSQEFMDDLKIFIQPRVRNVKKNFKVSKKYLVENYPDVFKMNKKSFKVIDMDRAQEIMYQYYIPNIIMKDNITIKMYKTKEGYLNRAFYKRREPKPFNIIKEQFKDNEDIKKYLKNNENERVKNKVKYLSQYVPEDIKKKLDDKQLYQILNKYIHL